MTPEGVRRTRVSAILVGAFAVALAALAAIAVVSLDADFQIPRSDSEATSLATGSVVVTTPVAADEIRAGDLVTVRADGRSVTGQVVTATSLGDEAEVVLRSGQGEGAYVVHSAYRVNGSVPYLGYVVDAVASPVGLVGIGALFVLLTLLSPALPEYAPLPGGRHRSRRSVVPLRSSVRPSLD